MFSEADLQRDPARYVDQRVYLHGLSWQQYEQLLAARGESSGVRIHYRRGAVELMTPSRFHERVKTSLGRLIEAWAEELDVPLNGYGSWTLKDRAKELGAEADECYVLGGREVEVPDLAIEVIWTQGGLDKLEIHRGLGVPEVWFWKDGAIEVWVLKGARYETATVSALLPELDLVRLAELANEEDQTAAVRSFRAHLRASRKA